MAGSDEDDVDGVALWPLHEVVALKMADDRLDGASSFVGETIPLVWEI